MTYRSTFLACFGAALVFSCAEGSDDQVGGGAATASGGGGSSQTTGDGTGGSFTTGTTGGGDPGTSEVFGHSKSTLYKVNPDTKAVGIVGTFAGGCQDVTDIALDEDS